MKEPLKITMIGAGGVSSYLFPILIKAFDVSSVILIDGDRLEKRNLDRQLFDERSVGKFKSEALLEKNKFKGFCLNEYLSRPDALDPAKQDSDKERDAIFNHLADYSPEVILCFVDNHEARHLSLEMATLRNVPLIIGANETRTSQVLFYDPRNPATDPRLVYPEIATDKSNSPLACTFEGSEAFPQLASANFIAAALALMTLSQVYEYLAKGQITPEWMPIEHQTTMGKLESRSLAQGS